MSNVSYIQIPNSIVRDSKINSLEFCILLYIKYALFTSGGKGEINLDALHIRNVLNIADNRTLRKALLKLVEHGYILSELDSKKWSKGKITVNSKKLELNNKFTQLPSSLIKHIHTIGCPGVRLMYYYESLINRKKTLQICYPSQEAIKRDTGLSIRTIIEYNKILVKTKLLKITQHDPRIEYTIEGIANVERYNNHYEVRLENLL
ncbi:helix-turn-helix domain-containing protein [Paenibacillus sp. JSM ZJ436]|uniref:helix-turn-helix domain-containing protein n=1 Tax=Paenibacillus sp. JSM ZJ436 TaxID=3376190 RepID=UPI00378DB4D8